LIRPKKEEEERKQEKEKPIGHDYRIQRAFQISMQLSYRGNFRMKRDTAVGLGGAGPRSKGAGRALAFA
jgi:hypothetical protein